jgi:hypothetical protein
VLWHGAARSVRAVGELKGGVGSGKERPGRAWRSRHGDVRRVKLGQGTARSGVAVKVWRGTVVPGVAGRGLAGLGGRGVVLKGWASKGLVGRVMAVRVRLGTVRFGEAGQVSPGGRCMEW